MMISEVAWESVETWLGRQLKICPKAEVRSERRAYGVWRAWRRHFKSIVKSGSESWSEIAICVKMSPWFSELDFWDSTRRPQIWRFSAVSVWYGIARSTRKLEEARVWYLWKFSREPSWHPRSWIACQRSETELWYSRWSCMHNIWQLNQCSFWGTWRDNFSR